MADGVHGPRGESEGQFQSLPKYLDRSIDQSCANKNSRDDHKTVETGSVFFEGFLVLATGVNVLVYGFRPSKSGCFLEIVNAYTFY